VKERAAVLLRGGPRCDPADRPATRPAGRDVTSTGSSNAPRFRA